ncbi:MAG TPA: glycosyl hydrolase family 18 protein [Longimicrobium sp.]
MRWTQPLLTAALVASLAACVDDSSPTAAAPGGETPRGVAPALAMNATTSRVVGYFPYYSGSAASIPYSKFTHINYAFIDPLSDGSLTGVAMDGNARLDSLVTLGHAAGVKVLISVGGWSGGDDSGFSQMAASSTARANFVSNLVTFVNNYSLDGVDIDWEFPSDATESANFSTLMSALDTAMHSRGKMLTAAVAAGSYYGQWIGSDVFNYVDYLFLMAYSSGTPHSSWNLAVSSLDYWRDVRGLPQGKTVLGVPFYGKSSGGGDLSYRALVRSDAQAPYKDDSNGYYYNGLQTIKNKTVLSLQRGSGVGIWEITQDTSATGISLLNAIVDTMNAPVPPYDNTKIIYDDARATGWNDQSWNVTLDWASTTQAFQGTRSIATTYTAAWGGIYLRHSTGASRTGLTKLEFWVHGGTAGGQDISVQIGDAAGWFQQEVAVDSYIQNGAVAAGTWRKVSIPLDSLGANANPIARIEIQDESGGTQPTFYVDWIRIVP